MSKNKNKNNGLVFMGLGMELVMLILGGVVLGQELDKAYKKPGYFTAGMVVLCMVGWFYHLIIMLKKYMKDSQSETKE